MEPINIEQQDICDPEIEDCQIPPQPAPESVESDKIPGLVLSYAAVPFFDLVAGVYNR